MNIPSILHSNVTAPYADLQSEMEMYIRKGMKRYDVTGMSVALVSTGDVVWAQGFGYADKERHRLANAHTLYKVGSITKVFTATAVMQLVEQGKLNLDMPIQRYIPELHIRYHSPTNIPITLRHIMTHTSGLASDALAGMFNRHPESFHVAIDCLNNMHAAYTPGTIATYSNLATDLLGVIIERAADKSYVEYMRENILQPINMTQSVLQDTLADPAHMSLSYRNNKYNEEYPLRSLPAGNLHSTVLEIAQFTKVVLNHGTPLISKPSFLEMTQLQTEHIVYDTGISYGLNWVVKRPSLDFLGQVLWHSGGTINFTSTMIILPEPQLAVVVLSNSSGSIEFVEQAADHILKKAAQIKFRTEPPIKKKWPKITTAPKDVAEKTIGAYATPLGMARIEQGKKELTAYVSGKPVHMHYHEDGWFSLQYRLFDLLPLPIKAFNNLRVQVRHIAGDRILFAQENDTVYAVSKNIHPKPVSDVWRSRLGKYRVDYPKDDFSWMEKANLKERDGLLILVISSAYFGTNSLLLNPISNDMAIIEGLGRAMQESLYAHGQNDRAEITFRGYRLHKIS